MPSRYQCFTHGDGWSWRLLGANNRVLARSPGPFPDAGSAAKDAAKVAFLAAHSRIDIVHDRGVSWRWLMVDKGSVRAVCAVPYARRMECVRAVDRFRASAPTAAMSDEAMVFRPMEGGHTT
jgi:hypothetical protein